MEMVIWNRNDVRTASGLFLRSLLAALALGFFPKGSSSEGPIS